MEERNQNEKSISLSEIWLVARANMAWVLLIVFLCVGIGTAYAYFFKKTTYTATIDVAVQALYDVNDEEKENKFTITVAYQYSALLAPEYEPVMKSHEIISKVNENKDDSVYKISANALSFKYTEQSAYFTIKYTYSQLGGDVATTKIAVADTLNYYVSETQKILNTNETGNYLFLKDNLVVTSYANQEAVSVNTGKVTTIFLAGIIGFLLAFVLIILIYFIDDRISTKEDAERISGLSILAFVDISGNSLLDDTQSKKGGEN